MKHHQPLDNDVAGYFAGGTNRPFVLGWRIVIFYFWSLQIFRLRPSLPPDCPSLIEAAFAPLCLCNIEKMVNKSQTCKGRYLCNTFNWCWCSWDSGQRREGWIFSFTSHSQRVITELSEGIAYGTWNRNKSIFLNWLLWNWLVVRGMPQPRNV